MQTGKDPEDKFLINFADLLHIFRKSRKTILYWSLAVGFLGIVFALTRPIRYEAEGTFREKGVKSNGVSNTSVIQLLSGASLPGTESEAASLMTSRRILKEVADKLFLQADLNASSTDESYPLLIWRNLSLAWNSLFNSSIVPVLPELCCPLKIDALHYTGEIPLTLQVKLHSDGYFDVINKGHFKHGLDRGKLGEPYATDELAFTLVSSDPVKLPSSQVYTLTVNPLYMTVKQLCKELKVEQTKLDKTLLKLKCEHRDRRMASEIVNATMGSFRNYLKNYHAEVAGNQLEYLNQRRDQLTHHLNALMHRHADFLSDDLSNSGFIDASKEMDFLAISQHEYKKKMLDNELEIKRLNTIKPGNLAYYQRYSANEGDPAFINSMLSEMRSLKQQRDALEIELQKKSASQGASLQLSFDQQLKELKEVQQNLSELRQVAEQFLQGKLSENSKLLNDPRFLLRGWFERVQKAQKEGAKSAQETKENFQYYLDNLERSFGVHERILQERLTHQQNPSGEYKGITLEVATNLYLDYSKELVQIEGTIRQNQFFIHQIEDPNFEITSLSSGLEDEVSNNMIRKSSDLLLNLRDQNNQSQREQERIKDELNLQRSFLGMHLKQMVQLMELNKELIGEKIFALENVSLELIHERISLLEKNLQDYLKSRLTNLQQERTLIQRHLENIHAEMAFLPKKWVSERLLNQEVETNQKIVEEIAKLVESKNISHNLDVIQSAPVDLALAPVHPMPPKVFLLGFLGLFLGGFLGSGYVLAKTFKKGLPATADNLRLMGFHVSGRLDGSFADLESSKDTLRHLQTYVNDHGFEEPGKGKFLLLLEGSGPRYASDLADLLLKRGKHVLTIDLDVHDPYKIHSPGLIHYLEGSIAHLPVRNGKHGEWLSAGGTTPYLIEMIHAPAFLKLMDQLKQQYDWIIAVSALPPASAEAESLAAFFPCAAVTLMDETVDDLKAYERLQALYPEKTLTFILHAKEEQVVPFMQSVTSWKDSSVQLWTICKEKIESRFLNQK